MQALPSELVDQVLAAAAAAEPLCIRAGGSKDFYGGAVQGAVLDPCSWQGIQAYEPSELYLTARAGTALVEVEGLLASRQQLLAFEPPHFGAAATIGGCVAAGLSGPRRFAHGHASGSLRDHVLGAQLLDGRGRVLRFGGTVIKNVAGYDVARLLAGSMGILGVLLEVTLKVLPAPEAETTLRFECDERQALDRLCEWRGRPQPISGSMWRDGRLWLRLSGAAVALRHACARLGGERIPEEEGRVLWQELREHRLPEFSATANTLWRIGVPDSAPPLELAGMQVIEGGGLRWLATDLPVSAVGARAQALGGHATRFRGGDRAAAPTALSAPLLAIHRRLKDEFDPVRIFNRGRMHPEL